MVSDKHRATLARMPMLLNLLITESAREGRLRISLSAYLCTSPDVIRRVHTATSFSKVTTASPLAIHPRASITVITHTFEETELSSMMRRSKRRARTPTEVWQLTLSAAHQSLIHNSRQYTIAVSNHLSAAAIDATISRRIPPQSWSTNDHAINTKSID